MATVKNVLVPLDFGESSARVLDFGRTIADAFGASLHLLHVVSCPMADPDARGTHHVEAAAHLDALVDRRDREIRHITTACVFGTPAPEIARYAAEHGIDLIVMGTHSHGPTFQMLTGSIAETVIGIAPCAVLAVKGVGAAPYAHAFDPAVTVASAS